MQIVEKLQSIDSVEFFKSAVVNEVEEGIISLNDDVYKITINENSKMFIIDRYYIPKLPLAPNGESELINIYQLADYQKHLKTGIDYKQFKGFYVKTILGKKPNFFNVRKISTSQVDEMIQSAYEYMEIYNKEYEEFQIKKEKYASLYKQDAKFLLSLIPAIELIQNEYTVKTTISNKFYKDMVEVLLDSGFLK